MALRALPVPSKVPHSTQFDAAAVKRSLGLGALSLGCFQQEQTIVGNRPVAPKETALFQRPVGATGWDEENIPHRPKRLHELYHGRRHGLRACQLPQYRLGAGQCGE